MARHYASDYLGKKWVNGARGPLTFDCWGLYYWIMKHEYDTDVPEFPGLNAADPKAVSSVVSAAAADPSQFTKIEKPVDGAAVLMGSNKDDPSTWTHVGVYLDVDGGVILHCREKAGVCAPRASMMRNYGLSVIAYYVPTAWAAQKVNL